MNPIRTVFKDDTVSYCMLIAVLAMNSFVVSMILLNNTAGSEFSWLTLLYTSSVAFGYYGLPLLVVITLTFLLLAPVRRAAFHVSLVMILIFVFYLILDSMAYRIVKFHIDSFWIEYILKDQDGLGLPRATRLVVLGVFLGVVVLEGAIYYFARKYMKWSRCVHTRKYGLLVYPLLVTIAFALSQVLHIVAYEQNRQQITSLTPHFPAYMPFTSHKMAGKYGDMVFSGEGDDYGYTSMHYPISPLQFDLPVEGRSPNIVIILFESWRYDAFSEEITPRMHDLGRISSVFLDHLSSGNQTTCGIFGMFYGLCPTYWKTVKANSRQIDNPVLIDALRDREYAFGVYAKSKFERHKIKDTIFNGIDVHETFAGRTIPEQDVDMTRQVNEFIEKQSKDGKPFMAFAFYKSSHCPYEYPPESVIYKDTRNIKMGLTNDTTDPAPYLNDYRNSVHYVDSLAGEIIDRLETLGELERTIVIVTTDHGESFNDNGANYWGHGSSFSQYQVKVPLILYVPDRKPAQYEYRTSHIDIAPTLLREYFGCSSDFDIYSSGGSLFDEQTSPRSLVINSYVNYAYVFGEDVYEIWPTHTRKHKLHDVNEKASPLDPTLLKGIVEKLNRFMDD